MNQLLKVLSFLLLSCVFISCGALIKIGANRGLKLRDEEGRKVKLRTPYSYPGDVRVVSGSDIGVKGLIDHWDGMPEGNDLQVLMVHGMGDKILDQYDSTVVMIDEEFSAHASRYEKLGEIDWQLEKADCSPYSLGLKSYLRRMIRNGKTKDIHLVFVHWSPATRPYKDRIDQLDAPRPGVEMAHYNRILKQEVFIRGLGDVGGLLDPQGLRKAHRVLEAALFIKSFPVKKLQLEIIQNKNAQAVHTLLASQEEENLAVRTVPSNTIWMTGSLGTKLVLEFLASYGQVVEKGRFIGLDESRKQSIVLMYRIGDSPEMDTIILRRDEAGGAVDKIEKELKSGGCYWYSMSNQLPLLSSLDMRTSVYLGNGNGEAKMSGQVGSILNRTDVVGFYDPNDILGFQSPVMYLGSSAPRPNSNLLIQLPSDPVLQIETVNPITAHSGVRLNPYFTHMLVNGLKSGEQLPNPSDLVNKDKLLEKGWIDRLLQR